MDTGPGSTLYKRWASMKSRCNNPRMAQYHDYGGRGITVCDEWSQYAPFEVWALASGYAEELELDRIDNDQGYSPSNCRWVSRKTNQQNSRQSKRWVVDGVEYTSIRDAAQACGVGKSTIRRWCEGRTDTKKPYPAKAGCHSYKIY